MQLNYSQYMGEGYPGLVADMGSLKDVLSRKLESATITPGLMVSRGTGEQQVVLGGDAPFGMVVRAQDTEINAAGELEYVQTDTVGVLTQGYIYADLLGTGTAGDPIYVVNATGQVGIGTAGAGQTQLVGTLETDMAQAGLGVIHLGNQGN